MAAPTKLKVFTWSFSSLLRGEDSESQLDRQFQEWLEKNQSGGKVIHVLDVSLTSAGAGSTISQVMAVRYKVEKI